MGKPLSLLLAAPGPLFPLAAPAQAFSGRAVTLIKGIPARCGSAFTAGMYRTIPDERPRTPVFIESCSRSARN